MDRFYEDATSIFVEAYDAFYRSDTPQIAGDVAFYRDMAQQSAGPVLEVACGTGRVTLPLAEAGIDITGADLSEGMLSVARRKAATLPEEVQRRLTLIRQDMTTLKLDRQFGFIFVPFRAFQHLLTSDLQARALEAFHSHLMLGGRLALHLFDPRLDLLVDIDAPIPRSSGTHEPTGRRYIAEVERTEFDHLAQIRRDLWRYAEIGAGGTVLREDTRELVLRWTYRWELHHLLALTGFAVEAEYSDFERSPPVYGKELIVVGRAE